MQEFFDAVREACSPQIWSRGVELARGGAVSGDRDEGDQVELRVATRGGLLSPMVVLYLGDEDWECSCHSTDDPCEHVAAATIALRRARKEGAALPASDAGRLRYRFVRSGAGLTLEREIITGDAVHPLRTTLDAIASGRVDGPPFAASQGDLRVEVALGSRRHGNLPRDLLAKLIDCLAEHEDVWLDDQPVTVSRERILPRARLADAPGGFRLSLVPDPRISERFEGDALRCGETLCVAGNAHLTGRELADLPRGRLYSNDQVAQLVTEVLPGLEERIPVDVETTRLPRTTAAERPRLRIQVERSGDRLQVLPTIVYGDPPTARVDAGELVHLRGAIPVRDHAAERHELRRLHDLGLAAGHRSEHRGEAAFELAARLPELGPAVVGDAHREFTRAPALVPRLEVQAAGFTLEFDSPGEQGGAARSVPGAVVVQAWLDGASSVPLSGGGFAALPEDWLARFGQQIADLLAARSESGALPTAALPALAHLCEALDEPPPAALDGLRPLLDDFHGIPPAELPADLQADLRDYQRTGVDWLCFLREAGLGALLADDMGLGKTLQALCVLRPPALVVAPTSVLHNWADELKRFRPETRFSLYHGPGRELDPEAEVILTSYAILRLDADALAAREWAVVVLDEAQNLKNPDSQVAQAAYRLEAGFRVALTGTPIENRLEELWSQFHFLNRGLLGGRRDFRDRTVRAIVGGDADAAKRLRDRTRPFVLRRLKSEVAPELPPRTEVVLHIELSEAERDVYDSIRAATLKGVVERLRAGGGVMAALEALLRLRQAACHSGLVPGQSAVASSKCAALVERLEPAVAEGHRALVFSQWTELLDRIEPYLRDAGLDFTRLDGSTRDRAGVVARFQDEQGPPVMLVSLKAGGTGLNLTAADHVFLMDPWWNPAVEDQATDRAHRIGQTRPVLVHRLVASGTVEERILELHESKRALSRLALEEAGQSGGLTRDDILGLLDLPAEE